MSTESLPKPPNLDDTPDAQGGPLVIDGISYIPSSVLLTGIPKLTLKDDRSFGVVDPRGESPRSYSTQSELGFFFNDTRHLSIWEITINGSSPVALAHELRFGGNTLVISMTNRDLEMVGGSGRIPRDTFLIRRVLSLVEDTLYEQLIIRNFAVEPLTIQIESWAGGKFEDIFEVRGFSRTKRGKLLAPSEKQLPGLPGSTVTLSYEGLDGCIRSTHIQRLFESEKIRISPYLSGAFTRVTVPAKGDVILPTIVGFDRMPEGKLRGRKLQELSIPETLDLISGSKAQGMLGQVQITSDNAILNRAIESAQIDIRMLLTHEQGLLYPYAGIPWFSAPFGRDGIITAYQCLPWDPALAKGVLHYALTTLGTQHDPFTDEQPGKVFHEMRRGEMAATREVPFIPYYGSVDSTPLALILLHEYVNWTMDLSSLKEWWPAALRALEWIERWGDPDQDGFLEYQKLSPTGLVNQGWKDSHDSIMHENGTLAVAPIRLCEVQGYAFRARIGMSQLARLLKHDSLAEKLRMDALRLRSRFVEKYWDGIRGSIHLALDGDAEPCKVLSSNMGHCLWSHILRAEHAQSVTGHLMSEALFNGYGIRTLADTEKAYNPLSYHNGSVWPHDNSLILEGFRYYSQTQALERLASAMIELLEVSRDFRLPELFCGFRRRGNEPPVPYEVACKPQAWAAGSVFLLLKSMCGLSVDLDSNHLTLRSPILTQKLRDLEIRGLRGRDWEIDLRLYRSDQVTKIEATRRSGSKVRVLQVK